MVERFDVVVVGAGINGMVAAAELAKAGRKVALVDSGARIGGFIASDTETDPGYVHDTYSSWHPLFVTGGAYQALGPDLHRHGLSYLNVDDPQSPLFASVADDGRTTIGYRDAEATARSFEHAPDQASYLAMLEKTVATLDIVGVLLGSELRDVRRVRQFTALARRVGRSGAEELARDLATSGRAMSRRDFIGSEVDHLWAPWLLHAGLSPDSAGGGLMLPLFAATMHGAGLPVVAGGSGNFLAAFEALLDELGVTVYTGTTVEGVLVRDGRAAGVIAEGQQLAASDVVASVSPDRLYNHLLRDVPGLAEQGQEARRYRPGRAAMQVHVALTAPLRWNTEALRRTPLVHLSSGSASTAIACAEAEAGLLPRRPTVVVGQQFVLDPSRVPEGAASLWVQLQEVPFEPLGDSAGEIDTRPGWSEDVVTAYTDRILGMLEEHAPGARSLVSNSHAITPADLARANVNAVDGDPYGGSLELDQNMFWRPGPRSARHRTPVPGVWHAGAATHPGPGLGGASGHLIAQAITAPSVRERAGARIRRGKA